MNRIGAHLLIWMSPVSEWTSGESDDAARIFSKIREMGFDGTEIAIGDPTKIRLETVNRVRKELERVGLQCSCAGGLGENENLVDEDVNIRNRGKEYLKRFIDICSDLGSDVLAGVLYGTFEMSKGRGRTKEEWNRAVKSIQDAADYGKTKNVKLCLEPVNRYENYLLNTAEDGVSLVKDIGRGNVGLHLDTYHMNIEEKDFYEPIVGSKGYLAHVHCSENDRGIPGTGHVNWDEVFKGLSEIGYSGWLVIESFYGPMREIPIVTSVWRKLADNVDDIPRVGLEFIREKMEEYGI